MMRPSIRKLTLSLTLALLLQWTAGCSVLEEIDKANESAGVSKAKKKTEDEEKAKAKAKAENLKDLAVKEWWSEATSVNTEVLDKSIIRCDVNGSVSFMESDGCLARGGTIQ